jgi:mono/diheme cytochrome c family protein
MKRLVPLAMLVVVGYVSMGRHGVAAAPDQPTFTRDVAPILHARCVSCHRAGEVAPMALLTYEEARPWARSIKNKVVSRQMPPWMAEPGVGVFANDPRLTDTEIATIAKWVDEGAPQGDPKDMPTLPVFTDGWQLGEPDHIIELPAVEIPASGRDVFPIPTVMPDLK